MRSWLGGYVRIGGQGRALWGNVKGMKKLAIQPLFQAEETAMTKVLRWEKTW